MNSEERYVFDTNVIISALLFNTSVPGQAFIRALEHGTILVSQTLVEEFNAVRRSFQRGSPFGSDRWQQRTAARLGVEFTRPPAHHRQE